MNAAKSIRTLIMQKTDKIQPAIYGPDPIWLDGCQGSRYWINHPFNFTGNGFVTERLSSYPVAVFQPNGRPATETPVVIGLQGMSAPYQWNAFIIPTLLGMGIACVLFDTPLAGERSLARNFRADIISEIAPLVEHGMSISAGLVPMMMSVTARDIATVLSLVRDRHGLVNERVALFGVSLGTLLSAFAFMHDGIGTRLLGTLGHADLARFARSYAPFFTPLAATLPARLLAKLAGQVLGPAAPATVEFLAVLNGLMTGIGTAAAANPMSYIDRVAADRRVRFLVGKDDPLVSVKDAEACARCFPDGECYPVPGLGHGQGNAGPTFVEHVRYYLATQLGDWR